MRSIGGLFLCALGTLAGCSGTGDRDAGVFMEDTTPGVAPPTDANRPRGPVVVGADLVPADYSCLPIAGSGPAAGDAMPVVLEVRDWSDGRPLSNVTVRAAADHAWSPQLDCSGHPDCATGVSDASGHLTFQLRPGRLWLATGDIDSPSPTRPVSWISGVVVRPGASTLVVPALAASTLAALGNQGVLLVGRVRDCAGAPVHRVHVRAFDEGNRELLASFTSGGVQYANDGGSFVADDRTTIDGVFVVRADDRAGTRIEAWGLRAVGGPEVLLGCLWVDSSQNANATLVDLPPLASDASTACGSVSAP